MNRAERRTREAELRHAGARAHRLVQIPPELWPASAPAGLVEAWRSRVFLAQVYAAKDGAERVTVCRTTLGEDGRWLAEISWDELMLVKREIGRAARWAVEIYPDEREVVNVSNMRHLWLLPEAPAFAWRRKEGT